MKVFIKSSIIVLAIIALATQGVVIFISNTSAADSITATKLSAKIDKISESNIDLQSKILSYASYQRVASRAAELGYKNSPEFISVYDPLPIALSR